MFEILPFRPPTVKWKADVFKDLHSVECSWKDAFSVTLFTGYVWTVGQTSGKPSFSQKTADMCGRDKLMWVMVLQRLILCLVRLITLQQSLHTSQLLRCPNWRGNCSIPGRFWCTLFQASLRRAIALTIAALAVSPWLRTPGKKNTCRRGLIQRTYSSSQGAGHVSFIESRKQTSFTAHHDSLNT